ncbi:MAG: ABC transporter ATP-binding protein [Ignavibacteria bacterium]|nr:ABC transporter ATP-binding protein [Ignavibacteria bacterium]
MNPIIQVKNLIKKYDDLTAVDGISFDVSKGEIFGLLGPNGAGKTTTLEIMETLREKTSGEVIINGLSIDKDQNAIKQIIGVQLQSAGFYPNLYLYELIELFAGLYNVEVNPDEMLKLVDLQEKKKSKFKELSGGQKQRFSICTTLINEPKIIFLDEPTTGLDPQARRNLWELIKQIKSKGTTIMLTTHYMDEAEVLCDRVGIIDNGKIVIIDTPDNLIDDLIKTGFERPKLLKLATLEDVFLNMTGKELRDN